MKMTDLLRGKVIGRKATRWRMDHSWISFAVVMMFCAVWPAGAGAETVSLALAAGAQPRAYAPVNPLLKDQWDMLDKRLSRYEGAQDLRGAQRLALTYGTPPGKNSAVSKAPDAEPGTGRLLKLKEEIRQIRESRAAKERKEEDSLGEPEKFLEQGTEQKGMNNSADKDPSMGPANNIFTGEPSKKADAESFAGKAANTVEGPPVMGKEEEDAARLKTWSQTPIEHKEYELGVDDVLDISIIKPVPMMSTVAVAPDGSITFPYIGNVRVAGLTLPRVQDEVQKRLADGYMEYPVVSVSLRESRSRKFIIYGQVIRPGAYPVRDNMTLLSAITEAGGLIASGAMGNVKLMRPRPDSSEFDTFGSDITSILNGAGHNIPVLPGDSIVVSIDKFFVYGQVNRPGAYPVEDNMTLLQAVTMAGGFVDAGSSGKVKLYRKQGVDGEMTSIDSDVHAILRGAKEDVSVLPGDTIVVSADKFFVSGLVNRPGAYPVEDNMTLLQAITLAGGFVDTGTMGSVQLLRPRDGESDFKVIETDFRAILKGAGPDVTVLPGDSIVVSADKFSVSGRVNRPGTFPVEENMTLLRAITVAGGFSDAGSTAGRVKLLRPNADGGELEVTEAGIADVLGGSAQNVTVLPGDTIVVSEDKFFVYGEVIRPGMYPLETSTTPLTAISMAGGFSKFGSASRVKVLRMNPSSGAYDTTKVNINDVISGSARDDLLLKPGDIVVVSEGVF